MADKQIAWFCQMLRVSMRPEKSSADPVEEMWITIKENPDGRIHLEAKTCRNVSSLYLDNISVDAVRTKMKRELGDMYRE